MLIQVQQAIQKLNSGEPVAIPTETVYGLAARIDQEASLRRIFSIKQRPFFDPLIVHVESLKQAQELVTEWPAVAEVLAQKFWPGPLTLVLPKSEKVHSLISSGLMTVGLRMPRHPLALEILKSVGVPLAAPSANRFGRTSPTVAAHVESEFDSQVAVVDGGACQLGLESTVLAVMENGTKLSILREGLVTASKIEQVLKQAKLSWRWEDQVPKQMAPGHLLHHYMPSVPLVIVEKTPKDLVKFGRDIVQQLQAKPAEIEGVKLPRPSRIERWSQMELSQDPSQAAREFYQKLRELSSQGPDAILFVKPEFLQGEDWAALWNRLSKAASLILKN